MWTERHSSVTVRIERRTVFVLLLIVPLLLGIVYWFGQPARDRLYLGGFAQSYLDVTGALAVEDVLAKASELFPPGGRVTANLGVRTSTASVFWIRFPLTSVLELSGQTAEPLALSFEEPRARRADLYVVSQDQVVQTGGFVREDAATYRYPVFTLPKDLAHADYALVRIVTGSSMRSTLYAAPQPSFAANYTRATVGLAILLGMMAASVAYLLPLGLVLRNGTYLCLGGAILFAGLYVASDQALLETYIVPGAVTLSRATSLASIVFFYGAFLSFAVRFLHFGRHTRPVRFWTDVAAALIVGIAVLAWVDGFADTGLLRRWLPYIGLASAAVLAGLMLAAARYTARRALMFAIMWLPLVVTGLLRVLLDAAPGDTADPAQLSAVYFGFAISLLLFAVVTPIELYRRELMLRERAQSLLTRLESFARIGRDIYFETNGSGQLVYLSGDGATATVLAAGDNPEAPEGRLPGQVLAAVSAARAETSSINNHIFRTGDGENLRWLSISGAPGEDAANFRGILRDVTAEIEQENLRQQERHLISLGGLAATVAHEINNVVQPIVNMSKGLRHHTRDAPAAQRMLDLIDIAAQQATTLVGQILKVGARSSDMATAGRPVDMAVQDAVETLRLILPAALRLETRIEPITNVMVKPGDVLQILTNAVANSRRASGDVGIIQIELMATPVGARLSVIDHGEGMSEATLARATAPHFTTKPEGRAAGIGLSVVKRLVEEHGGSLTLSSQQGQGTRIDLDFPRQAGDPR